MSAVSHHLVNHSKSQSEAPHVSLTHVELIWRSGKIQHWLRFGAAYKETSVNSCRRLISFKPNIVFCCVRWAINDRGFVMSQLDIARTVHASEAYQTLPLVRPGGDILLRVDGWSKVQRVLARIDEIEKLGVSAVDVAPEYWRHVHNRFVANMEPRSYTRLQHKAWMLRRRTQP